MVPMWAFMALSKEHQAGKSPTFVAQGSTVEVIVRQARVEELRQLVAKGAYKANPQRLALKILVESLNAR
jgi:anti-sigma28 factor (negative regulator of flagellin synthesis)